MRGFTLVELLIVLAIAGVLFVIVSSIARNTYPATQLRAEADAVMQLMRKAQMLSTTRKEDSVWGVYRTASTVTLFAGASYATRDVTFDQTHIFRGGITASGAEEIVFEALQGTTTATTITLMATATSEEVVLSVNQNGVIERL